MKECGWWEDTKVPLSQCNALIALIYTESVPVLQPGFWCGMHITASLPAEPVSPPPHCGHYGIAGIGFRRKTQGMYESEIRKLEDIITALLALEHNYGCLLFQRKEGQAKTEEAAT